MARNLLISLIFTLFILGVISCKKHNGAATPAETIIGTWKEVEWGYDNSNIGQVTSSDLKAPSTIQELTFNNEGTDGFGTGKLTSGSSGNLSTMSFIWTTAPGDSIWLGYTGHDTVTYYLYSISSSELILTTSGPISPSNNNDVLQMYIYNKQ